MGDRGRQEPLGTDDGRRMHVISRARLRAFWESRKADAAIARRDLAAWYKLASKVEWANFAELRQTFGSADQVGNCVVFDVGNNRFRVIGRVNYAKGRLYVLKAMDHAEYDKKGRGGKAKWIDDCGCHEPPPKQPSSTGKPTPRGRKGGE